MKRLRKQEEKKEKKREQEALAAQLREVAVQRRTEALRLMSVLLARAAETRYITIPYQSLAKNLACRHTLQLLCPLIFLLGAKKN